jgi:hypothetical protein
MQNWFDRKPQIKETESMRKRKGSRIARLIAVPLVFVTAFISTPQAAGVIQAEVDEFRSRIDRTFNDFAQMMANTDTLNPRQSSGQDSNKQSVTYTTDDFATWCTMIADESQDIVERAEVVAAFLTKKVNILLAQVHPEKYPELHQYIEDVEQGYKKYVALEKENLSKAQQAAADTNPSEMAQVFTASLDKARDASQYPFEYITSMENPQHPDKVTTYQEFDEWIKQNS